MRSRQAGRTRRDRPQTGGVRRNSRRPGRGFRNPRKAGCVCRNSSQAGGVCGDSRHRLSGRARLGCLQRSSRGRGLFYCRRPRGRAALQGRVISPRTRGFSPCGNSRNRNRVRRCHILRAVCLRRLHHPRPRQQRLQPSPQRPPLLHLLFVLLRMSRQMPRRSRRHDILPLSLVILWPVFFCRPKDLHISIFVHRYPSI